MITDKINALGYRKFSSLTAVIQHGKSKIVTFNKQNQYRGGPTYQWYKCQDKNRYQINRLPKCISYCDRDTADNIFGKLCKIERVVFAINDRFRFFTDVSKHGRADYEEQIFEPGKIKE